MKRLHACLFVALGLCLLTGTGRADSVTFTDGSVLVGTIEQAANGKIVITTDIAGKLEIDWAKVASVATTGKFNVELNSKDTLLGPLQQSADGKQTTVKSQVGDVLVTSDKVTAIWPEGTDSPALTEAKKKAQEEIDALKPKWTATIEGGIIATEGNSDTLNGNARFELLRKTSLDLLKFYATASYGEQNDIRNRSEYIAGARYESSFPHRWKNWGGPYFWFARTEAEYDEFENLDFRGTIAAGLGHYWLQKKHHEFTTRVGAGYRHQSFADNTTTDDPILDAGFDYRYDVAKWASFTHATTYSPSLENFSEYRLVLDTALTFPIANTDVWKFKMGVKNEYNSDPRPGFEELDNTYYANIVLTLK